MPPSSYTIPCLCLLSYAAIQNLFLSPVIDKF